MQEGRATFSSAAEASAYARYISSRYKVNVKISHDRNQNTYTVIFSLQVDHGIHPDADIDPRKIAEFNTILQRIEAARKNFTKNQDRTATLTQGSMPRAKSGVKSSAKQPVIKNSTKKKNTYQYAFRSNSSKKEKWKILPSERDRILAEAQNRCSSTKFERGGISEYEEGNPRPLWDLGEDPKKD